MKYRTLEEITKLAGVEPVEARREQASLRRARLQRLATLIEAHVGRIRLFSMMEYVPVKERIKLRQDESPLYIAFRDAQFREQGLKGDRLGDAIDFFQLSMREAHHIFCDCNYSGAITPGAVAARARSIAEKKSLGELWRSFTQRLGLWRLGPA
ncbi:MULTISPECIES: hypothetical protein [Methylosinus]|nr:MULTISPECIES: hypothetical protein [Methylosinus]